MPCGFLPQGIVVYLRYIPRDFSFKQSFKFFQRSLCQQIFLAEILVADISSGENQLIKSAVIKLSAIGMKAINAIEKLVKNPKITLTITCKKCLGLKLLLKIINCNITRKS